MWPIRRPYTASNGVPHVVLRLNNGLLELPHVWIEQAQHELLTKALLSLEDMTAVDRLAYLLLTETF